MIVIDVYGKIEKTVISEKLQLCIANLPNEEHNDWKQELIRVMEREINQQELDNSEFEKDYGKKLKSYDANYLKRIIDDNFNDYNGMEESDISNYLNYIADNMICLFFDYKYENMPFFDWKTNCFDGRFCEEDYAEKIINFIRFVRKNNKELLFPTCTYSSNTHFLEKTRVITILNHKRKETLDEYISQLKKWGEYIDEFLENENDYYKFDYIVNALYKDNEHNMNHFFRSYSLLEALLLKSSEKTEKLDEKVAIFLEHTYGTESKKVARLLRQMRNKIGHGDFMAFNVKSEEFATAYMKQFSFDYSEYSRLNWILLHVCCLLDDLLAEILFVLLHDKYKINKIKNNTV